MTDRVFHLVWFTKLAFLCLAPTDVVADNTLVGFAFRVGGAVIINAVFVVGDSLQNK